MSSNIKYIGLDVHKEAISIAVLNGAGKLVMESIIETKAATLVQFVGGKTIAKAGAPAKGKVTYVKSSGRLHAPGQLAIRLTSIRLADDRVCRFQPPAFALRARATPRATRPK